jgi:hypothetical protein
VVFNVNAVNRTYINRPAATTAIAQRDFAAGHPVSAATAVRLDERTRAQLAQAPVLPHPLVTPTAAMAAPQAPAHALPPSAARPVVTTGQTFNRGAGPVTQPTTTQPVRGSFPEQRDVRTTGPVTGLTTAPTQPQAITPMPSPARPAPPAGINQRPAVRAVQPAPAEIPSPRPADEPRPLVNHTPPQTPQPAFVDQQREIQRVDPGRPLGPQQVENVRQGKPAGAASQPEPVQHPQPAKQPPPPPRKPPM